MPGIFQSASSDSAGHQRYGSYREWTKCMREPGTAGYEAKEQAKPSGCSLVAGTGARDNLFSRASHQARIVLVP